VAAWRSGNVVGRINEVALRRARLVLGWVKVFGGQTISVFHQATPRPTQPPTLSGREMRTSQSAMMLCGWGVKAGITHSICG